MKRLPMIAAAIGLILAAPAALAQPDNGSAAPAHKTAQKSANKAARQSAKTPARQATISKATARKTARATQQRVAPRATVNRTATAQNKAAPKAAVNRTRNVTTNVQRNVTTRKVDVTSYRKVVQAPRRYRATQAWVAPSGFTYRRFSLDERVPTGLLAASFFLSNFGSYGLVSPPYGYVWVRDGTDALLVNRYNGRVVQVQYGLFY